MTILASVFETIIISFVELLYLVGILIVVGFLLGLFERYSNGLLARAFGPRSILFTAWIGTPIHELGHLLMCFIFGHRVSRVKLLQLNSPDGTLGYVSHQYNPSSMYQQVGNFFIGLGPIFSGIGSLLLGMYFFVPKSYLTFKAEMKQQLGIAHLDLNIFKTIGISIFAISKSLFTWVNMINPLFWIFLMIAISISSHIALSRSDIEGSAKGLAAIFFVLILFNFVGKVLNFDSYWIIVELARYNAYVLAFSSIAILFSTITLMVSFLLYKIKTR
jgi:tryptophan-rich sensory protein